MLCAIIPSGLSPAATAGLIAAIFGVTGWMVKSYIGGLIYFYKRISDELELMIGLKSEIEVNFQAEELICDPRNFAKLELDYKENEHHKQFLPLYRDNIVYDSFKKNVTSISEAPLENVIRYYNLSGGLDVALASLTGDRYEAFDTPRKLEIYQSIMDEARDTVAAAKDAILELEDAIRVSKAKRVGMIVFSLMLFLLLMHMVVKYAFNSAACSYKSAGVIHQQQKFALEQWRQNRTHLFIPSIGRSEKRDRQMRYTTMAVEFQSAGSAMAEPNGSDEEFIYAAA